MTINNVFLRISILRLLLITAFCVNASEALADGSGGDNPYPIDGFGGNAGVGGGGGRFGKGGQGTGAVDSGGNGFTNGNGGAGTVGRTAFGGTAGSGGSGGISGTAINPQGSAGGDGGNSVCGSCTGSIGASGGGGGGDGWVGSLNSISTIIRGGNGGNGGNATDDGNRAGADGGGGGGGGAGAVIIGGGTMSSSNNIFGGRGGNGGNAFAQGGAGLAGQGGSAIRAQNVTLNIGNHTITGGNGGNGGNGGSSSYNRGRNGANGGAGINAESTTITNSGTITGGNAGGAGNFPTSPLPVGGFGITGNNINIINNNTLQGGFNADGSTRVNSIYFTEGINSLELQYNWLFNGNISANSGTTNKFIVGGSTTNLTSNTTGTQRSTLFDVSQFGNKFQNFSSFYKTGSSTWRLINTTTANTPWTLAAGILQIAADGALGSVAGTLTLDGGTLQFISNATLSVARAVNITNANSILDTQNNAVTISGTVTGNALTKNGNGVLTLTGVNTYNGTNINQGTLEVSGNVGSISGNTSVATNALLSFNRSGTLTYGGLISGDGALRKTGSGTLILAGNSTYAGGTTLSSGTLQLGNGATSGSIVGNIINNATLAFNRSDAINYGGIISGNGAVIQNGSGATTLSANNSYSGTTSVSNGSLYINGNQTSATGTTTVSNGAMLGGNGTIGGAVTVANGGILSPGAASGRVGTLTINGSLTLNNTSILNYTLGEAGVINGTNNDLTVVNGNLTLDGILNITESAPGAFTPGLYRLIDYRGTLTNNQLNLGSLPETSGMFIQTSVANQVNLINSAGLTLNFWDGGALDNKNDGMINGGNGIWQASTPGSNDNWTLDAGTINAPWSNAAFAIFTADPGTVTIDNSEGQVIAAGMQFASDGYTLNGAALTLVESEAGSGKTTVEVGDHTSAGAGYTATIDALLQGATTLVKSDLGTLILNGLNTYSSGTAIEGGTLQISSDSNLGALASSLSLNTGTLATTGSFTSARAVTLDVGGGTFAVSPATTLTMSGAIGGSGSLTKDGSGTLTLTGASSYTGQTDILNGTLQLGNGLGTGSLSSNIDIGTNGVLAFNRNNNLSYAGIISGSGQVNQRGSGVTLLTGENTYTGITTVSAGTLQLGDNGNTGSIASDVNVESGGTLAFQRNNLLTYGGNISGNGAISQTGSGNTVLTGSNAYLGATNVTAGGLYINGNQTAATGITTVNSGATLGGTGIIGGDVTIADGATLSPGAIGGIIDKLTINGSLTLNSGSILDYHFGLPYEVGGPLNDLVKVNGDLVLDGTINVTATTGGSFGPGIYRVIDYAGALTNNGLELGDIPPGRVEYVQTSVANQVNLVDSTGLTLNMWDGGAVGNKNNGVVNGGNGVWQTATVGNDNWTVSDGLLNAPWQDSAFAIFQAEAGNVTVDNSLGQVTSSGMQFASDGYVLNGAELSLVETESGSGQTTVRVGNGSLPGAAYTAIIDAILQGNVQLVKTDLGTLVLNGANTYTGGTAINGGTLRITSDSNLGQSGGGLSFNGGTLATDAMMSTSRATQLNTLGGTIDIALTSPLTSSGIISGTGTLTKIGTGLLSLTGENTYTGNTVLTQGTLQIGDGSSTGSIISNVTNNATLAFNRNNLLVYDGVISGTGVVNQVGTGSTVLTANSTYTGLTTISSGTLQLGNGGNTGSLTSNVNNNGILAFNRNDTLIFNSTISGNGLVDQRGSGSTVLTAANNYLGGTLISSGTLQLGNGGNTGSIIGDVDNAGTLAFNRNDDYSFDGLISGSGGLRLFGAGITTLIANNTYSGLTSVEAGTLQAGDLNVFSPDSIITVEQSATLALDGLSQVIAGLNNAGTVNMTDGSGPSAALTVKGDYIGNGGVIVVNTLLSGDASPSDRLIIDGGNASGNTSLLVKTGNSMGGLTNKGVALVQTENGGTTSAGAFRLDPNSDGYNSTGILNVGAYNYSLKRGGNGGEAQDWYLVSLLSPVVGSYLQERQSAMAMHKHTLHDRQWQVPGQEDSYTWLRMEGSMVQHDGVDSQEAEDRRWVLHGGSDIARFSDGHDGSIRVGLMAQYGTSSGNSEDEVSRSSHSVKSYSAGIYGTWFGHHDPQTGPYIDTWLMHGRFDNDVTGQGQRTESYRSRNTTMSIESGYKLKVAESPTARYYLEPQAQIIYALYRAKDHTTASGSVASDMSDNSATTRLGVRLYEDRLDPNGQTLMQGFIEANWWHGPSSQTMRMDETTVRESMPADRAEFKFGVKGNLMPNLSVTGAVGVDTNLSSYKAGRVSLGVNYSW
ncbi:autotransporter-associated beta strand repeat-containing protein [Candidatus Symbiopectobacterium sp. NZEC135]|uniref:autotransporter-associated beta strand repeat-containing protein n=1 Tax=Candidatus Symbiopectobacterium sp. NZEC135 TaxID=2820471 RepID=UPI00222807D7|nr:autotransporter-associated beta strand repeat-containing protein [Candidatus Symbiopectobacterium sp. NZEC135]MCW2477666.1 autotransporter outer membrane beta-barrel domain-containing protein [Candidatus Symbiopectobacterium sp. NZEC135]